MYLSKCSNGVWYVYYLQPSGKKTRISTREKRKSEALKFLNDFEAKIKEQSKLKHVAIDLKTFRFNYLKYSEMAHRPKTTKQLKTIFDSLLDFIGNVQLYTITTKQIKDFLQLKFSVSAYTAQKYLAYLRSAFNEAIKDDYISENPCSKIDNFRIPEKQPLFFSEQEFEKLLCVVDNEDLKDLIIFAVNTGMRQMEILSLRWNQINFKDRLIILDNATSITKSKKVGTVPLNLTALQRLTKRELNKTQDNVFTYLDNPVKPDFISKKFKKYVIKASLNNKYHFHTLRHTAASWIIQKGGSMLSVSKLLRHSDLKVTEIYSHLRPEDLIYSVELLDK
jgi:integrase